jgi:UDP-galactopyranose mutase
LPIRFDYRRDYFLDSRWQGIPLHGYTKMFERMLDSPNIHIELDCDYFENKDAFRVAKKTVYTGPIDRYFDCVYGELEWRTVNLEGEVVDVEDYQGTSVMNYADMDVKYTRIHEFKHLRPERAYGKAKTIISRETSGQDGDNPYYPINTARNNSLLEEYKKLQQGEAGIIMGGRLGNYDYLDMDKTILAALDTYERGIV